MDFETLKSKLIDELVGGHFVMEASESAQGGQAAPRKHSLKVDIEIK